MARKPRITKTVRMPKPKQGQKRTFALRTINEADGRLSIVKRLRLRLHRLMEDVNADTLAKEILCARAIFLMSYLESQEADSIDGGDVNWRVYLGVLRQLTGVLDKLGLDKAVAGAKRLEDYLVDCRRSKKGKYKVVS